MQGFYIILAAVFPLSLLICIHLAGLLQARLLIDMCEPLALFLLGYHSLPVHLFQSQPLSGLHRDDWKVPWISKRQFGQLVVVGEEEASLPEDEHKTVQLYDCGRGYWSRVRTALVRAEPGR
jgi:hypothetical protein